MALEITWEITTVDFTISSDGKPETNLAIHWRCVGRDGELASQRVGVESIPDGHPAQTPANSTSDADMLAYLFDLIDEASVEAAVTDDVGKQGEPEKSTGKYWDYPADTRTWAVGIAVAVDDILVYRGVTYITLQAHTTQADWPPPAVPALFSVYRPPDGPADPEWVAGEAVAVDDRRTYQGTLYEVIQAHTTQVGWEPPNVPALWRAI